jgi:hypothetical protein
LFESSRRFHQLAPVADDGVYEVTCPQGHRDWVILQPISFELLYEVGASAIVDGYYREAVSAFAGSLERFFEFYMRVHCEGTTGFDEAWKDVAQNSQLQLGAFTFVYLLKSGGPAPKMKGSRVNFRNAVIHKGRFPTREEAIDYGDAVAQLIQPILLDLKTNHNLAVQAQVAAHMKRASAQIERSGGISRNTQCPPIMIQIASAVTVPAPDLKSYLAWLERSR